MFLKELVKLMEIEIGKFDVVSKLKFEVKNW